MLARGQRRLGGTSRSAPRCGQPPTPIGASTNWRSNRATGYATSAAAGVLLRAATGGPSAGEGVRQAGFWGEVFAGIPPADALLLLRLADHLFDIAMQSVRSTARPCRA